jgi:hypothetical protein
MSNLEEPDMQRSKQPVPSASIHYCSDRIPDFNNLDEGVAWLIRHDFVGLVWTWMGRAEVKAEQ